MGTKVVKATYWATTGVFSVMMVTSAVMYLTAPMMDETFKHLGLPAYFRIELAIFKIAGVAALLLPTAPQLKEWAYAGFFITLVSATTAHLSSGDGLDRVMSPVIVGLLLLGSYLAFHQRQNEKGQRASPERSPS